MGIDRIAHDLDARNAAPLGFTVQKGDLILAKAYLNMDEVFTPW